MFLIFYLGAIMLKGMFRSHGLTVSRIRILESLRRVDPEGCEIRRRRCVRRYVRNDALDCTVLN